jgi:hypothetical protein
MHVEGPAGLGVAGRAAWKRAVERVDGADEYLDAVARYAHAVDVADKARKEWRRLGEPFMSTNPNGANGVQSLLKVIEASDAAAGRFGAQLGLDPLAAKKMRTAGRTRRPPGAASAPDRAAPPRVTLRSV